MDERFMDVNGKVALITGGATGIGLAIADNLLAAGLKKAFIADIIDENGDKAVKEMTKRHGEGKSEYIHLDVNSQEQFEDAFKYVINKEGRLDIVCNNAGILSERKWELQVDTNLKGVVRGCMLALKYMKNKGGCVMNTSSILSYDPDFPYIPLYTSTKHGVIGLTKAIGHPIHYEENGVRFVALGPGLTDSRILCDTTTYHFDEVWAKKNVNQIHSTYMQSADVVGRGAAYVIQYGPPGSQWVVEDGTLYRVTPPERQTYQTKIMDL